MGIPVVVNDVVVGGEKVVLQLASVCNGGCASDCICFVAGFCVRYELIYIYIYSFIALEINCTNRALLTEPIFLIL